MTQRKRGVRASQNMPNMGSTWAVLHQVLPPNIPSAPPVRPGYQAIRHLCFSVPLQIVTMSLKAVVGQRKFGLFSQPFSATKMIPNT